ncbi:hypothetical protein B6I21_05570 [candidate division KSB1 bacterium 4572_119]|nr:MAG: hypothetical protein B6I21_05570 [candidate division KSB1 bacterium 4572_119]
MKQYHLIDNPENSSEKPDNQFIIVVNSKTLKKIFKYLVIFISIFLFVELIPYVKSLLMSLGISFILSFVLYPLVDFLESRGVYRVAAIIIVFFVLLFSLYSVLKFLIPSFSHQISTIQNIIQNENPESLAEQLQLILSERVPALQNPKIAHSVSTKLNDLIQLLLRKSFNAILSLASSFILIITIPFITFFLLKDGRKFKKQIIQLVPNRYFEMSLNLLHKSGEKLGGYIRGQLMVSTIIGTLSVTALFILGIPYFFIIGVVAGMANMIPYFGPWVGAMPAVIVAFLETDSTGTVIGVIIAFALIQLLDNILVSPFIVSKSVQIHPLMVILALLVGSGLAGILGMLVAVPVFAVLKVIIEEIIWGFKNYRLI